MTNLKFDYTTYCEIKNDLLRPILGEGIDFVTLKQLYESKIIYLENLRQQCFRAMNAPKPKFFTVQDYQLILQAKNQTSFHLHNLVASRVKSAASSHQKNRKI